MDLEKAVKIMSKDFKESIFLQLQNGLFSVMIRKVNEGKENQKIILRIETDNYSCKKCSCDGDSTPVFLEDFSKVEDAFTSLFILTKDEGKLIYSKITDKVYETDLKLLNDEEKRNALNFICNKKIEECCVCNDLNVVKTHCKHNLCRLCYKKILDTAGLGCHYEDENGASCPICREDIA